MPVVKPLPAEYLFVDADVPDAEQLILAAEPTVRVIRLRADEEPLLQIAVALDTASEVGAVHILAHGAPGQLSLAGTRVDEAYLSARSGLLSSIQRSVSQTAKLALWACDTAAGAAGRSFTRVLSALTGTRVYAAAQRVGAASEGGTWAIGTAAPFSAAALAAYPHTLPTFDGAGGIANNEDYTEIESGVTLTTNFAGDAASTPTSGGGGGASGDFWAAAGFGTTSVTLTFDTAVTVTSFVYLEADGTAEAGNYTFTVTTGSGTTFALDETDFTNIAGTDGVTLTPDDWFGVTEITITSNVGGGNWTPGLDTLVFNVNTAPTSSLDNAALTYDEGDGDVQIDGAGTVNDADGDGDWNTGTLVAQITANNEATDQISISDTDGDGTTITISGTDILANGVDVGDLSVSGGTVTDGTALTITWDEDATNAIVQEVLQSLRYETTSDDPSELDRTVTITATDGTGASAVDTRTIEVTSVNSDPTISGLVTDVTVTEDTASDVDLSASAFADVDSAGSVTVVLAAGAGVLSAVGSGGVTVAGSGTGTLTLTGTFSDINTFLDTASNLQYVGTQNTNGDDATALTVTANDGEGSGNVLLGTVNIDITADNDAPTLSGLATALAATEEVTTLIDSTVTFADLEGDFDGGTVTVSGLETGDVVSVQNTGSGSGEIGFVSGTGAVSYEGTQIGTLAGGVGATATITLNASATSAAVDALLEALTFTATDDDPAASRTLTINVTDGDGDTLDGSSTYTLVTGSDNPLDDGDPGTVSFLDFVDIDNDGDLDAFIGENTGNINFHRNDGTAETPNFVEITGADNPFDGEDVGSVSAPTFVDIDDDGDYDAFVGETGGTIVFYRNDGNADVASFTEVTGASNPMDGFDVGSRSAPTFVDIDDDGDFDAFVGAADGSIHFFRNDGNADVASFTEVTGASNPLDSVATTGFSGIDFFDIDGDGDQDALIGENFGEFFFYRNDGNADSASFTEVTGTDNPFDGLDVGDFSKPAFADIDNDGSVDVFAGEFAGTINFLEAPAEDTVDVVVSVTGVEDAPTVTGLTDRGAAEDTTGSPDFSGVTIADTDTAGNITVTITATDTGAVLGAVDGAGVGAGVVETASGNNVVTLVGTAADITTYLSNASAITYTSSLNRETNDTISIQADDGVSTPNAASTATIVITPVNDLPTASDETITINEDTSHTFAASEFNFADVDTGASLASVRIDTLTLNSGTLQLSGVDVSATDVIAVADINAGNLVYTPGPDDFGDGLLTFTFSVNDGTGFAASTSTMTIDVTDITDNEAPTGIALSDNAFAEDRAGAAIGTLSATDPEGEEVTFSVLSDDRFIVDSNNVLRLADDVSFDFETQTTPLNVEVQASDGEGGTSTRIFPLTITDIVEPQIGSNDDDTLSGDDDDDRILAGGGNDTLTGGQGDDTLRGDDGDDVVSGGNGDDVSFAGPTDTGNDTVEGNDGNDVLGGGSGNDLIVGGDLGTDVSDTNPGACGDDILFGGDGDDLMVAGSYNPSTDTVVNTGGSNELWGGSGSDTMFGDNGDDIIGGGVGDDSVQAGGGNDTIYGGRTGSETSNDTLRGGNGDDVILASVDSDVVFGEDGNDTLFGGAGDDTVDGGNGDDILWAGGGNDDLTGGPGADTFTFGSVSGNDTVTDFGTGADTLDLRFASTDFASVAEVQAAATNTTQGGQSGVLIDLGDGDSVFVVGLTVAGLTASTVTV